MKRFYLYFFLLILLIHSFHSYDLTVSGEQVRSYREVVDGDSGSMVLLPRAKGNLHEFIANTDCAVSSPPKQRNRAPPPQLVGPERLRQS